MNRARLLLIGAGGQVGKALHAALEPIAEIRPLYRADLDLTNAGDIAAAVESSAAQLVINAAAYTQVDAAESDRETAWKVNADAPGTIATAAARAGAAAIHFSTDYVFDGKKGAPYTENDRPSPLSVYGQSKLAGDEAVQSSGARFLIFRTSWVYASEGRNFLTAIAKRARETGRLRVVTDQIGAPTHAGAIADAVASIVGRLAADPRGFSAAIAERSGVYNLSAAGSSSWFEFAQAILDHLGIRALLEPITTAEYGAAAPRPAYSLLSNARVRETFDIQLRDWRDELSRR